MRPLKTLAFCFARWRTARAVNPAARIAVRESLDAASAFAASELLEPAAWYGVLSAADEAVAEDSGAGFTTLVSLCVTETRVCGASCGDSGALLLDGGRAVWLTEDQRKNPPVGSSAARPVTFSAELGPSWKLLVVSDGVWNYVGWERVAHWAQREQGKRMIIALRQAVREANGGKLPDDFTVALVQSSVL